MLCGEAFAAKGRKGTNQNKNGIKFMKLMF